jgi:nucleotide-binding universal stress UspA family protein
MAQEVDGQDLSMTHHSATSGPAVIAFDGSDESLRAIEAAGRLLPGARAFIVHVGTVAALHPPAGTPTLPPLPGPPGIDDQRLEQLAQEVADAGVRAAEAAGLRAQPVTGRGAGSGDIAYAIAEVAQEHDAAVIVVGSRGRSGLKASLLGSVSSALLGNTAVPVLVVPPAGD